MTRLTGIVTYWNATEGYGYVRGNGTSYPFRRTHLTHVSGSIHAQDRVTFDVGLQTGENAGRPSAVRVTVEGYTPPQTAPTARAVSDEVQAAIERRKEALRAKKARKIASQAKNFVGMKKG